MALLKEFSPRRTSIWYSNTEGQYQGGRESYCCLKSSKGLKLNTVSYLRKKGKAKIQAPPHISQLHRPLRVPDDTDEECMLLDTGTADLPTAYSIYIS